MAKKNRRVLQIDLTDPRFDGVFLYAQSVFPGEPVQSAIYELLLNSLAENYRDSAIMLGRRHAFTTAQRELLRKFFTTWKEIGEAVLNSDAVKGDENGA